MAADESVQARKGKAMPMLRYNACKPMPMPTPRTTPYYPALPELSASDACVADQALMKWRPTIKQPPEVDLRVRVLPAQSVSVYASMPSANCRS